MHDSKKRTLAEIACVADNLVASCLAELLAAAQKIRRECPDTSSIEVLTVCRSATIESARHGAIRLFHDAVHFMNS
ncbi:hypothetical protein [Xanthobacter sediminis]